MYIYIYIYIYTNTQLLQLLHNIYNYYFNLTMFDILIHKEAKRAGNVPGNYNLLRY